MLNLAGCIGRDADRDFANFLRALFRRNDNFTHLSTRCAGACRGRGLLRRRLVSAKQGAEAGCGEKFQKSINTIVSHADTPLKLEFF
jgi:hypothetical protein